MRCRHLQALDDFCLHYDGYVEEAICGSGFTEEYMSV
jgi:hypothetical protein